MEGKVSKEISFSGYLQFKKAHHKGCWLLYIHINIYIYVFQKYYSTSCKIRMTVSPTKWLCLFQNITF